MRPRRPLVTSLAREPLTIPSPLEYGPLFEWQQRKRMQQLLPELALRIGRSIRAGRPLEHAIDDAAQTGHMALVRVNSEVRAGRPLPDALDDWLHRCESDAERLLAAALVLGSERGGDLARSLDVVGEGLRDDIQLDARRRTLLTQSRLSAGVLVALPVVFATLASVLQGGPIYKGWVGLILLAVGGGLDVIGLLWIKRLLRGLR